MANRFSKKKIILFLLNHKFVVLIRGPFYINFKVRVDVFLNNKTDLALTIHFHRAEYSIRSSDVLNSLKWSIRRKRKRALANYDV